MTTRHKGSYVCSDCGAAVPLVMADEHPFSSGPEKHGYRKFTPGTPEEAYPSFDVITRGKYFVIRRYWHVREFYAIKKYYGLYEVLKVAWASAEISKYPETRASGGARKEKLLRLLRLWFRRILEDQEALDIYWLIHESVVPATDQFTLHTDAVVEEQIAARQEVANRLADLFDLPKFWLPEGWS